MATTEWFTSSYSSGNGQCVQVQHDQNRISVRDSAHPNSAILIFPPAEWRAFLNHLHGSGSIGGEGPD